MNKKSLVTALVIMTCLISSCIENNDTILNTKIFDSNLQIDKMKLIEYYVSSTKSSSIDTRGEKLFTPILNNSDTVLILANYNNGWDLFSYDCRVPMLLISCDTGNINTSELNNSEVLDAMIEELSIGIANLKSKDIDLPIDNSWTSAIPDSSRYREDLLDVVVKRVGPYVDTKWCQSSYWEKFTPRIDGNRTKLGCCAIAVGNFLRYTDSREGLHLNVIPTTVTQSGEYYSFGNFVSDHWDNLATSLSDPDSLIDNTAMFLANIAQKIHSDFGNIRTTSNLDKCKNYLDSLRYGNRQVFNMIQSPYSASIITQAIDSSKLVFVRVKRQEPNLNYGHVFIVDGYKCTCRKYLDMYTKEVIYSSNQDTLLHAQVGELIGLDEVVSTWINSKVNSIWKFANDNYLRDKKIMFQGEIDN